MKLLRWIQRFFPSQSQTYERGWECAHQAILAGEDPKSLRAQACRDCEPDAFTRGWKARCDE